MKTVDCREMATSNEVEDLVTCGVCFCEYDQVNRTPKFLPCSHTVCLLCLKKICQTDSIKCPFCRETSVKSNVESLPNNPYALHMLKFKKNKNNELPKPIEVGSQQLVSDLWIGRETRNRTVPLKIDQQSSPAVNAHRSLETVTFPPFIPSSSVGNFVLDNSSVFILRIFKSGNLKGEIVIRPVLMFEHRDFMQKLGDYCFRTQKIFCNTINKAVAGVYVAFAMCSAKFQPAVPSMARLDPAKTLQQETLLLANQVRIALVETSSDKVTGWTFILPLEDFQHPKFAVPVKQLMGSQLFGRVASHHMMETATQLINLTKKTERTGYTITLESQSYFKK